MKTEYHVSVVRRMGWPTAVLAVFWMVSFSATVYACDDWVAKVVAVEGLVQRENAQRNWQPLQAEQTLCPGESVRVGNNSRAALHLRNNTFTRLDANSVIHFPTQATETRFWIELKQGLAHFISRIVHQFEVATPYVNAVVEGTEFIVSASEQGAVSVVEGKVTAYNDKSRTQLTAGQQVAASTRDGDLSRFNIPPTTVVEWAIYYPPILTLAELPASSTSDKALLQAAIIQLQNNRIDQALLTLDTENPSDIIKLAQATLLLKIGRLPEFNRVLTPILQSEHSGLAYGLKTIADIAHHDNVAGRKAADTAVEKSPDLAATWIALSYAQQAELDLPAALASAHKATRVQPGSLLAAIRLSELYLAQGDIDAARKTLEAVPDAVGQQAALENSKGFVQLFRLKIKAAKEHFHNALQMDSSNPQTHLGLGLALLRDGDLEQGRQELEYAVSLDPLRSVLRSYMGRAYFEEKSDKEAIKQWELAKQFDPNDPTPYFYTGVYKLFANDPVGAIDELETSRNLNDKRAIYRSETLLQSDAASRSATLARAYDEVGYDQGVLLNGWDALRRDPTSSEGHRLLADHYANDPRYETARVSELLQSQLWQPLSAYPLQPQLSETNLSVVASSGPQKPSLNEFHSLITQDGINGLVNAVVGSDNTQGSDLVGTLLTGPLSLSVSQFNYSSDGWRKNADQEQEIISGLVQYQISNRTSLLLEARKLDIDQGNLGLSVLGALGEDDRTETEKSTYRLGLKHEFDAASAAILSVTKQYLTSDFVAAPDVDIGVITDEESKPEMVEAQYSTIYKNIGFLFGFGLSQRDHSVGVSTRYLDLELSKFEQLNEEHDVNAYSYLSIPMLEQLVVNLGVDWTQTEIDSDSAYESFGVIENSDARSKKDQWSPKFGLTWNVDDFHRVRLATFRSYGKDLVANATISPTNIVGFNQLYDDPSGSDMWSYAFAVDGRVSKLHYGLEFVERDGEFKVEGESTKRTPSERSGKVYAYSAINSEFSVHFGGGWFKREFDLAETEVDSFDSIDSITIPIELHWFLSDQFSLCAEASHYKQTRKWSFADPLTFEATRAEDTVGLWVANLSVKYLLPARFGYIKAGVNNIGDRDVEVVASDVTSLQFYPSAFYYFGFSLDI